MAHQRTASTGTADPFKEPHSMSLKVLRLSRPSLAIQHPLPAPSSSSQLAQAISPAASLAYTSPEAPAGSESFVLSPLLTLPPSFGSAYVGETFACTLCANNEIISDSQEGKQISGVRIEAEMKTPTTMIPLAVTFAEETKRRDETSGHLPNTTGESKPGGGVDLESKKSLQGIVEYHLKEEGNHVLAVTVSYTETASSSGRARSFRKLYQFVARGCLVVRTKIGPLPGVGKKKRFALEAQLENSGEDIIVLEAVALDEKPWCNATSLNWDIGQDTGDDVAVVENPVLGPGDVHQVCFLAEQKGEEIWDAVDGTGRLVVGMLSIEWRGPMGNKGSLSTGWLGTRILR